MDLVLYRTIIFIKKQKKSVHSENNGKSFYCLNVTQNVDFCMIFMPVLVKTCGHSFTTLIQRTYQQNGNKVILRQMNVSGGGK